MTITSHDENKSSMMVTNMMRYRYAAGAPQVCRRCVASVMCAEIQKKTAKTHERRRNVTDVETTPVEDAPEMRRRCAADTPQVRRRYAAHMEGRTYT